MKNEQGSAGFCDFCIYHNSRAADLHYKIAQAAQTGFIPMGEKINKPTKLWLKQLVAEFLEND